MKLKLAIAAVLAISLGVSQISTERVYIWTLIGNRFALTEVTGLTRVGSALTVPVQPPGETLKAGQGIILVRSQGQPTEILVDTASFWMQMSAPSGPGACRTSTPSSSQRIMAQSGGFLYVCVPPEDPATETTWRWGRAPLEFTW